MKTMEQINTETVTAFIENAENQPVLDQTDQFFAGQIGEAFPDRQYAVEETFAQGEKVVIRIIMTATHQGMFVGNPPTGRTVKATQFREFRVVDGKIAEHRGWFDTGPLLPQIKTNS
ncbi:ester cyclase [Paenibacillus sp. P25]|nr:ester cyclase [Paenibacillus sp. P25]